MADLYPATVTSGSAGTGVPSHEWSDFVSDTAFIILYCVMSCHVALRYRVIALLRYELPHNTALLRYCVMSRPAITQQGVDTTNVSPISPADRSNSASLSGWRLCSCTNITLTLLRRDQRVNASRNAPHDPGACKPLTLRDATLSFILMGSFYPSGAKRGRLARASVGHMYLPRSSALRV